MKAPPPLETLEQTVVHRLLGSEAGQKYREGNLPDKLLLPYTEALRELSRRYVQREPTSRDLTRVEATAYALYYSSLNSLKVAEVVRALPRYFQDQPHSILDVGSGPGTASLALKSALSRIDSITLIERSAEMRRLAQLLVNSSEKAGPAVCVHLSVETLPKTDRFTCIVCAHLLAELSAGERQRLLTGLIGRLTDGGVLLLIEPALQSTTQLLMADRDMLLQTYPDLRVLFPCTHAQGCPMLRIAPESWCHGTLEWDRPPLVRQLDALTGFNKHRLKYSALALTADRAAPRDLTDTFRVIEAPTRHRRGMKATLCGDGQLRELYLANAERSPSTEPFRKLRVWDKAALHPIPLDGNLSSSDVVTLLGGTPTPELD